MSKMIQKHFLEWLGKEINTIEDKVEHNGCSELTYEEGFLHALEHVKNIVQQGHFNEIISVQLKEGIKVEGLKNNKVYDASSVVGGLSFKVITESGEIKALSRDKVDVCGAFYQYITSRFKI